MPFDVLVGYIFLDSILTHGRKSYPTAQDQNDFINSLTCEGDTLNYVLKYLYKLADYNPFLYYDYKYSTSADRGRVMFS